MDSLVRRAQTEAASLQEALAHARAEAATTLAFFAEGAGGCSAEADNKALDMLATLKAFLTDLRVCLRDIVGKPDVAAACLPEAPRSSGSSFGSGFGAAASAEALGAPQQLGAGDPLEQLPDQCSH